MLYIIWVSHFQPLLQYLPSIFSNAKKFFFRLLDLVTTHLEFIVLSFVIRIAEAFGAAAAVTSAFAITAATFPDNVATTFVSSNSLISYFQRNSFTSMKNISFLFLGHVGNLLRSWLHSGPNDRWFPLHLRWLHASICRNGHSSPHRRIIRIFHTSNLQKRKTKTQR